MGSVGQFLIGVVVQMVSLAISTVVVVGLFWRRITVGKQFFQVKARPTPPSILNDPQWGTHTYMNLKEQGIKLHYVEAGDPQNPLILFVHGFPECWFSWRHQLKHFSKNFWVVAVDMRGYGNSDKPSKTSQYNTDLLVQDLRHFVIALGKDKCTLVAHDWGAVLAWRLVSLYPELFSSHISLNGPHPTAFTKCLRQSFKQIFMSWYVFFFQTPLVPELVIRAQDLKVLEKMFRGNNNNVEAFPDDVIEAYKYYYSQKGALTPPINYYRNIKFGELHQVYPKIKVPTLIIWGTEDLALSKSIPKLSAEECESCDVKFVEGASHWVQQDNPDMVNALIDQYIDLHHGQKFY
ncbi:epoxide hydrolase 4 [Procambarus clarkii]|uniref:epoxide hydrolase 4 n=1 Tax=Procambarus clarkii TaxID=6728 RepID=UPI001E674102|nr:epoxide hydrolase 4-like [Procambarus clarkii]